MIIIRDKRFYSEIVVNQNYQNDLFTYQISDWSKDFELRPFKYAIVKSTSDEVFL